MAKTVKYTEYGYFGPSHTVRDLRPGAPSLASMVASIASLPSLADPLTVAKPAAKAPLTFEEQMAKVAAGAKLVPTFGPSRADPEITLGGVATGLL